MFVSRLMMAAPALVVVAAMTAPTDAGCCCGRSAACQERLTIRWQDAEEVAPAAATTGTEKGTAEARAMRADRPLLVLVADGGADPKAMAKLEEVVLKSEQVAIGAKFFTALKVPAQRAAEDRVLAPTGEASPRVVLLSRDYKVHEVLAGASISAGKLVRAMSSLVKDEYETDFDAFVKDYAKLLNERDRLDDRKSTLEGQKSRADGAKAAKLEGELKDLESEIYDWDRREERLLAFKLKAGPKATA
jgi:hypothetical protein